VIPQNERSHPVPQPKSRTLTRSSLSFCRQTNTEIYPPAPWLGFAVFQSRSDIETPRFSEHCYPVPNDGFGARTFQVHLLFDKLVSHRQYLYSAAWFGKSRVYGRV